MKKEQIADLFTALRGGIIQQLSSEGGIIRFKIILKEVASKENPDYSFFYASLMECKEFFLQPFRNENVVMTRLDQVESLAPEIHEASVDGDRIKVFCAHKGVSTGARLIIQCKRFEVYNESFDSMDAQSLAELRFN